MNTAIVSDLHFGSLVGADVVRREGPQERLLAALEGADRVVLLGDALELRELPLAQGLEVARPFLERLGRVTAGRKLVLVPGNHDYQLGEPFLARRRLEGGPLAAESEWPVRPEDGAAGRVAAMMPDTELTLSYPGVRLRDDVYATHGHYLDAHLTVPRLEAILAGAMARITGRTRDLRSVDEYEAVLSPMYSFYARLSEGSPPSRLQKGNRMSRSLWKRLHPAESNGRLDLGRLLLGRVAIPSAVAGLNLAGLGPMHAEITAEELRRSGLAAMGRVAEGMGVEAGHVIFGHTHRSGPWPGDDHSEWRTRDGARLWNTGSWLHEDALLGARRGDNPYEPGAVMRLRASGPPELENVLRNPSG